eukprot:2522784-Amphidinium_carterae.1
MSCTSERTGSRRGAPQSTARPPQVRGATMDSEDDIDALIEQKVFRPSSTKTLGQKDVLNHCR